ncbi:uncharacterized protein PAC_15419 [Phialocephala subalpina]|uniref:Uncharacterized protein n=1 Tax=Phialocephala subalpina TaxID=576137 RepID=A0A1L7XKF1_9HELO|nr:uncharacterized protein PAC_15419 [Phialocephala subalpina]
MEPAAETAPQSLMTQDDVASALVTYIFSGIIGSPKDKGVSYSLLEATDSTFSWIAALEEEESTGRPIDRYRVDIDRLSRKIQTPMPISLSEAELQEAILAATGHHLKAFSRFADEALSISYKVSIEEDPHIQYIVQLRHHGKVTSMNLLMSPMANFLYPRMSHEEKLVFVRKMALAFQASWCIPLPQERLIGEFCAVQAGDCTVLTVNLDRHYNLGGPFTSARERSPSPRGTPSRHERPPITRKPPSGDPRRFTDYFTAPEPPPTRPTSTPTVSDDEVKYAPRYDASNVNLPHDPGAKLDDSARSPGVSYDQVKYAPTYNTSNASFTDYPRPNPYNTAQRSNDQRDYYGP